MRIKFLILLCFGLVFAQKQIIAVSNITSQGLSDFEKKLFYNKLESELVNMGVYEVTSRQDIDKILMEQKFQKSGCTDQQCAAEIGRLLNADLMLLSEILFDKGSKYISTNLKLVSVETAKIKTAISKDGSVNKPTDELSKLSEYLVELYRLDVSSGNSLMGNAPTPKEEISGSGTIYVNSEPMGAVVIFDNKDEGFTPKSLFNVNAGTHRLILSYDGYERSAQTITLETDSTIEINQTLVPLTGNLNITSIPSGANIYLNDEYRGTSPLILQYLDVGNYFLKIKMDGYEEYLSKVEVEHDNDTDILKKLDPLPAFINLFSVPNEVSVYIDGKLLGKTKNTGLIAKLTPGKHSIEFKKKGYISEIREIELFPNQNTDMDASLKKLPKGVSDDPNVGWLSVSGKPNGSKIKINSTEYDLPYDYLDLSKGNHSYKVYKPGYESKKGSTKIDAKKHQKLKFILNPLRRKTAMMRSLVFPGLGQFYAEKRGKGLFFTGMSLLCLKMIMDESSNYTSQTELVNQAYLEYNNAIDDVPLKASIYQSAYDRQQEIMYSIGGYSAGLAAIWIWNVFDARSSIPDIFNNYSSIDMQLNKKGQVQVSVHF